MSFFRQLQIETTTERDVLYGVPFVRDAVNGHVSHQTYLAFLTEAYHHVKNTLPLLTLMRSRISHANEWLRDMLGEYIAEETGHDEWVLSDLRNAGGDPEVARKSGPSLPVELMNAFNYDYIKRTSPLGYFGMIFVLENASAGLATKAAERIGDSLGLDESCFTYLTSHGSLDVEHVEFVGRALDKITDPRDQAHIVHAAKVIYRLYADMFLALPHRASH